MTASKLPIEGIKVLDFTRVLSGPFCTMILGDLGADVLKVEMPGSGDETRKVKPFPMMGSDDEDYFYVSNRNKRSVCLDLKSETGLEMALALASQADIVVENFAPGVMERLGLGAAALHDRNDELIYVSIKGFGSGSPLEGKKVYDSVVQAFSGLMSMTGEKDGPPVRSGMMIGDLSGSLYSAIAALAAIQARANGARRQAVEIPLVDTVISLLGNNASEYFATGSSPTRHGPDNPYRSPSSSYQAADGRSIQVLAATQHLWLSFCEVLGAERLAQDERFKDHESRVKNMDELNRGIGEIIKSKDASEWVGLLDAAGIPCALVYTLDETLNSPHVKSRGLIKHVKHPKVGGIRVLGSPMRFSPIPLEKYDCPPLLGEHTFEALHDWLGMSEIDVRQSGNDGAFGSDFAASAGSGS